MFKNIGIVLKNSPTSGDSSVLNKLIKVLFSKTENIFSIDDVKIDRVKTLNIEEFNDLVETQNFWDDTIKAQSIMKEKKQLEKTIDQIKYVEIEKDNLFGNITSGGTESIFLSILSARNWSKNKKGINNLSK